MTDRSSEARLTDLELKYMHEADRVEKLSHVVWEQAKAIARLEKELRDVRDRLAETPGGDHVPNEKPPHW